MRSQIKFDQYEAAVLLVALLKVKNGQFTRGEAARQVSVLLRNRARRKGFDFDDSFRTESGISAQLSDMDRAYTGTKSPSRKTQKLFIETVALYRTNRAAFDKIIREESAWMEKQTPDIEFWLKQRYPNIAYKLLRNLALIQKKSIRKGLLTTSLEELEDDSAVEKLLNELLKEDALVHGKKQKIKALKRTLAVLAEYIEERNAKNPDEEAADTATHAESEHQAVSEDKKQAPPKPQPASKSTPSKPIKTQSDWIKYSFTNDEKFKGTIPVYAKIGGTEFFELSWASLMTAIVDNEISANNPNINNLYNQSLSGSERSPFFLKEKADNLSCSQLSNGYWIIVNYNLPQLVHRIAAFCFKCGYSGTQIQLYGAFKEDETSAEKHIPTDTSSAKAREIKTDMSTPTMVKDPLKKNPSEWILAELENRGIRYNDLRDNNGCLWIAGDEEKLHSFVAECQQHGYTMRYVPGGCRSFPNEPVWWTKNREAETSESASSAPLKIKADSQNPVEERLLKKTESEYNASTFFSYLSYVEKMTPGSCASCVSSIRKGEDYASSHGYLSWHIFGAKPESAKRLIRELMYDRDFSAYLNEDQSLVRTAFVKFVEFCNAGIDSIPADSRHKSTPTSYREEKPHSSNKPLVDQRWLSILAKNFPDGYILNNILSRHQAAFYWQQRYGEKCQAKIDTIDGIMISIGTVRNGRVFASSDKGRTENNPSRNTDIIRILNEHYKYGFKYESIREIMRFRQFAEEDGINLPGDDEQLTQLILSSGTIIDGKLYADSASTSRELADIVKKAFDSGATVIFYDMLYEIENEWMTANFITSEDILKERLRGEFTDFSFSKNFMSSGKKVPERTAVTNEMLRVWGEQAVQQVDFLCKALPYISTASIKRALSGNPVFSYASEGAYLLLDHFIISEEDKTGILDYVKQCCDEDGFASLSAIPLGDIEDENYELTLNAILYAVYYKILSDKYFLNGKILTRQDSTLDTVTLLKQRLKNRDTVTFDEASQIVIELTGETNRRLTFQALYDSFVRVDKDRFVADKNVHFDIDAIDKMLDGFVKNDFCSLRIIATFVMFPGCGQSWNYFLLESYCYKYSKKYSLHVLNFNDKNVGIIAKREYTKRYTEMLAIELLRSGTDLDITTSGEYLFENGYTSKRYYSGFDEVVELAGKLRREQ